MRAYIEDEHTELKRTFNDTIAKEIVAFLNTDGGILYIGVEDNGDVCGVDNLDETLKKVADIADAQILPDCRELVELGTRYEYGDKCLLLAMKQAYDYCADVINVTRTWMVRDERKEQRLFDNDAFREVWYNACLHNNWADGTPPAIYVFDDRMEIISTGGLPANLSKEDFYKGVSKPVNEDLARLFIRLDLMEQMGHGMPLVVSRYGKDVFEFMDFFIKVTIPFAFELTDEILGDDPKNDPKVDPKEISERQRLILGLIAENPSITRESMTQMISVSEATIKRELSDLQKKGILAREGSRKDGRWVIIGSFESK